MKIALFNCHMRSIPPKKSGGIEKIINYLAQGLLSKGCKVTLFSTGDSEKRKNLEIVSINNQEIENMGIGDIEKEELNKKLTVRLVKVIAERQDEFDIINNHCLDAGLPILNYIKTRIVSTIHETLTQDTLQRLTPFRGGNS